MNNDDSNMEMQTETKALSYAKSKDRVLQMYSILRGLDTWPQQERKTAEW